MAYKPTLEMKGVLEYIDDQIREYKKDRKDVADMNCYAAGYNDAVIEEFRRLREYITGESHD